MNKTFLGIGIIILSIAAFFMWINPHYANVKVLKIQLGDSTLALSQAQELGQVRSRLVDQENQLNPADLAKLKTLLPDSVDNVRFIIDIQGIAARYGLSVQDIAIGDSSRATTAAQAVAVGPTTKQFGSTQLGFSVTTTYANLITFLKDLEKSLHVTEIKSLSFTVDQKNPNVYKVLMSVSTFWLNQQKTASVASI